MTKAKVYFSDMRTRYGGLSLPQKLGKLIEAAGIGDIDFQNKFAAIKIHRKCLAGGYRCGNIS